MGGYWGQEGHDNFTVTERGTSCVTDLAVVSPPMRVSDGEGHMCPQPGTRVTPRVLGELSFMGLPLV